MISLTSITYQSSSEQIGRRKTEFGGLVFKDDDGLSQG